MMYIASALAIVAFGIRSLSPPDLLSFHPSSIYFFIVISFFMVTKFFNTVWHAQFGIVVYVAGLLHLLSSIVRFHFPRAMKSCCSYKVTLRLQL
jgi:hypothetical protein